MMAPRIAGTGGMASRCVRLVSFIRTPDCGYLVFGANDG
jgi:hypothetical protein